MRKRLKQSVDLSTPPVDRLFQSDEERTVEDLLNELQETKPKKIRNSTKALEERVFELEVGINVRNNFAERQQMVILKQQEKMDIYERFLQDIEIHYMITKDYRKVQDLIDRACQWSLARRTMYGDLSPVDKAAALELATRRLGEDV
jgi:hypothetical protein